MMTTGTVRFVSLLTGVLITMATPALSATVKLTGWFSCDKCTAGRVAKGEIRPSNPVCAKECIDNGDHAVFLSEQGKESLRVKDFPAVTDELGYHVEVTGTVDAKTKTIAITTVKRLSFEGASCTRPRPGTKK